MVAKREAKVGEHVYKGGSRKQAGAESSTGETWDQGTVWVKCTDKKKAVTYSVHECWNMGEFIRKLHLRMLAEGGKAEQVTQKEYRKATGKLH